MSRSVWSTGVATLGDYIKQLREIDNQRNKPNVPDQSCKYCFGIGYDASGQSCGCECTSACTDGSSTDCNNDRATEGGIKGDEQLNCPVPCGSPYNCKCNKHNK